MSFYRVLFILGLLFPSLSFSQEGQFNAKFFDLNLLMEDNHYTAAIAGWEELLAEDSTNCNIAYKLGYCYLQSETEIAKAPGAFKLAIRKVANNYNSFSSSEKSAPVMVYYYYAQALHLSYQIDSAVTMYNKFMEESSKRHYLRKYVPRELEMLANAKELIADPISIKIKNIGSQINGPGNEYGPVISLDENTIYFTSRRMRKDSSNRYYIDPIDGEFYEDVYASYRDSKGNWSEPEVQGFSNVSDHDGTISLSPDGQTLYIFRTSDGTGNIYKSELDGETWTEPVKLPSNINSKYRETHITISSDNQALYFSSNRKGGYGGMDIYRCLRLPNGEWSLAQNVGPEINTEHDEDAPFIHPDGKTLFFSSKGHKSMGGYDIFYSEKSETGAWTEPINVGYPINTVGSDIFYMTSADGTRAYYSAVKDEDNYGKRDIYVIEYEGQSQKYLTLIKGFVKMPNGEAIPDDIRIVMTDNETGEFIAEAKPLARNGSFVFIIPSGKNYNLSYESNGQAFYNENIYVPEGSEYREVEKEIFLNPIEGPEGQGTSFDVEEKEKVLSSAKWLYRPNKPVSGEIIAKYIGADGEVKAEEELDEMGYFNHLGVEEPWSIEFYQSGKKLCNAGKVLLNAREDVELAYDHASCSYAAQQSLLMFTATYEDSSEPVELGTQVQYLDKDGAVLFTEIIDNKGSFLYHQLAPDQELSLVFLKRGDKICEPLIVELSKRPDLVLVGNSNCEFKPSSDPKVRAKRKQSTEQYEFKKYFGYNKNAVEGKEFDVFLSKIVELVKANGTAKISIESSASKVPTKSYASNLDLTKKRAYDAQKLLVKKLEKKGVKEKDLQFINTTTLVQGPEYEGDAANTEKYGPFQYVFLTAQ